MSSNASLSPSVPSVNLSSMCFEVSASSHVFTALLASYFVFFLPLCALTFHQALRRQRRDASSLDVFTYNILALELIGMVGGCFFSVGVYADRSQLKAVGICVYSIITPGQMLFHSLTSVERYLAVTHPVVYLGLRKAAAVRVRNMSIAAVWAVTLGCVAPTASYGFYVLSTPLAVLLVLSVLLTSFCGVSIFCALTGPSPGDEGGNRDRVDQLKRRALQTITVITGVLLLNLAGVLLCVLVGAAAAPSVGDRCVALMVGLSSTVPSSYVMPLLFLHRAGKLQWLKRNMEPRPSAEQRRQNEG